MIRDLVDESLARWRAGGFDEIECTLVNAPAEVVPLLVAAFRGERDPEVRQAIVFVVWQRRSRENVAFLVEALRDSDRRVWQEALDGLVALGRDARAALVAAHAADPDAVRRAWIDEAIEQIDAGI